MQPAPLSAPRAPDSELHLNVNNSDRPMALVLVVEKDPCYSAALTDLGIPVVRHQVHALNTALTNDVASKIKACEYAAVVAQLPVPNWNIAPKRHHAAIVQLCTWAKLCRGTSTPMVLL